MGESARCTAVSSPGPGLRSGGCWAGGSWWKVVTTTSPASSLWWKVGPRDQGLLCVWSMRVCLHTCMS